MCAFGLSPQTCGPRWFYRICNARIKCCTPICQTVPYNLTWSKSFPRLWCYKVYEYFRAQWVRPNRPDRPMIIRLSIYGPRRFHKTCNGANQSKSCWVTDSVIILVPNGPGGPLIYRCKSPGQGAFNELEIERISPMVVELQHLQEIWYSTEMPF